ncbi:MAG TPA: S8 family serine peptidase, partial [Bryobacteraceae bacterium]|nr:S8 family serine peptidase [Bryobacteraceae bacterium]
MVGLELGGDISQILNALVPQAAATLINRQNNTYLLNLPPGIQSIASKLLAAHPMVNYVEPNHVRNSSVLPPNDPYLVQQWALTTLQAAQAWSYFPDHYLTSATAGASRVKVAVIDTGADCTHPDFMNAGGTSTDAAQGGQLVWSTSLALTATTITSPACTWQDDNGHGTHTAGIVAAATNNGAGVGSLGFPLQLIIYKVMNQNGVGSDFYISTAIYDAIKAGAQVISMSLGGPGYSQTLQSAINAAWQNNVLVVAAAGNETGTQLTYPGDANFALGVAATDNNNNVASWSNYGTWVKIAAPGVNILSTYPNGGYATLSGTSMATPHVAALAGLLFAANPGISAAAVAQRIQQTAMSPNTGWNQYIGYGVINAGAAMGGTPGPFTQGSLTGQVTDINSNPINNATLTVGGQTFTTAVDPSTGYTDGLFRINLSPGTYTVTVTQPFYTAVTMQAAVVAGADTMLNVQMGASYGEFTGAVTYNGVAVAGAPVAAVSNGLILGTAITDSSGTYSLYVPAGTYTLTSTPANYLGTTSGSQTLSAKGTVTVNLALSASGNIAGTVSDLNGLPVANAHIDFTSGSISGGAQTGAAGTYSTYGLPAGTYTVTASATGYSSVTIGSVTVSNNISTLVNVQFSTGIALSNGLAGNWPMNEGSGSVAFDHSSSGYNAALANTAWVAGPANYAVSFGGSSSQGVTPTMPFGSAYSVSVWVNPASTTQSGWAGLAQVQSGSGMALGVDSTGGMYKFAVNGGAGSTGSCAYVSVTQGCAQGGAIASGWHMVTGTYDGATAILYVDGVAVANDTFTTPSNITMPMKIGASWNGALDNLRLYSRALTASEVAALFAQGNGTTQTGQTIAFGALSNETFGVAPFAVSATATSGLAVSFNSQTSSVCTVSGSTVTLVAVGTCTIQATQAGNASYSAAAAVNQSFSVTNTSQTISFGALSNKTFGVAPFAVSATATSGLAVSFNSQSLSVCTVSGSTVTLVAVGTCTIQATQAGNASYSAATAVNQSFSVTQTGQMITFGPLSNVAFGASPFAVTATASSGLAVSFSSQSLSACTVSGSSVT